MAEKRGRKRKNNLYFGPDEEAAVLRFLACEDDVERNKIYNEWLRSPFNKMIESIIRKYKLYRKGETFEDLHSDTLSFLMLKADKFQNSHGKNKGKKAYSYYGTICKNYIIGLLINDTKKLTRLYSYEDYATKIEENDDYTYHIDDGEFNVKVFIDKIMVSIQDELDEADRLELEEPVKSVKGVKKKKRMTDNERKVGLALIAILTDWERILDLMNGGKKFNKNSVLESMRNYTHLNTKDIRLGMKRYKEIYKIIKLDGLEHGLD
jgi:hypothetical protein